ncbi:hypothetical protein LJK88_12265 [Paenibacillus sp. P26]|nr:hypothetical protein LJK88_12265 [Paenibacillus sp. P26]UUZ89464.1 hypothetical protein LJK87_25405 [Paenibacillus sp. P25]
MLKRYSFFGTTLELIAVMGVFFAAWVLIVIYTVWQASKARKKRTLPASGQGDPE